MQTQLINSLPQQMKLTGMLSQKCLFSTTDYQVTETTDDFVFCIPKKILLNINIDKTAMNKKNNQIQERLNEFQQLLAESKEFQVRTRQDIDTQVTNERHNWDME